ncbi:glycosyltransferase [Microbacterium hibisci]|uniref:glycosyltransferase n=1 Tax=Microbacterium hibisci TaxID=2036000 RepID=UPI0019409E66|nr:glycosyltransferase [Microbacterium hibisci]
MTFPSGSPRVRDLVLVFDVATPTPDEDSGSQRAEAILRVLGERFEVAFLPVSTRYRPEMLARLAMLGVHAPAEREEQVRFVTENARRVRWALIARPEAFAYWYPLLAVMGVSAPVVYDSVDAHHVRLGREAEHRKSTGDPRWFASAAEAEAARGLEGLILDHADVVLTVCDTDADAFRRLRPATTCLTVSNAYDAFERERADVPRSSVVFVGPSAHRPNADAVAWIESDIAPRVARRLPEVEILVVGRGWEPEGASVPTNVTRLGWVEDLSPVYDRSFAAIAPLRYGAGVKGKVAEAIAHAVPVVGTACATEGMGLRSGVDVLTATSTDDFVDALARLRTDERLAGRITGSASESLRRRMGMDVLRAALDDLDFRLTASS